MLCSAWGIDKNLHYIIALQTPDPEHGQAMSLHVHSNTCISLSLWAEFLRLLMQNISTFSLPIDPLLVERS
jgi:hypothetical protein